jgi:RNA polymerase sigma-70 factor (ECF subfamily)
MTADAASGSPLSDDLFATTRWTVVVTAQGRQTPEADQALQELCATYWYPLYAFVRRRGCGKEDAEDLTQAFFARLLERHDFTRASSERGRFRAYLLAAMKNFLANEWDRAMAQKRGGGALHLPLDWASADTRYQVAESTASNPDKSYDRAWAVALLERVIARLRKEATDENKLPLFDALKDYLTLESAAIPYAEVAEKIDFTPGAARVAVHRLRKRYRELLRLEIAQTVAGPDQVEEEMQTLFQAFSG